MKKSLLIVAGVILGACITAQAGYRTEVVVRPVDKAGNPSLSSEEHQFEVQFKIIEVAKDGTTNLLSTPKVATIAGQEAQIKVGDEKEENGVFCTALVKEVDGGIEAITTVVVKEKGIEQLNTAQTITVKK